MKTAASSFLNITGCLLALLFFSQTVAGQSKAELEKRKKKLHEDIEYTNKLLSITKKSKSASMNHLVTLNRKISYRDELISTIATEISVVDKEVDDVAMTIGSLNEKLGMLKKQYGEMLYLTYKNQNAFSKVMFIFSAEDFNQAFKRLRYIKHLSDYRLQQRDLIVKMQDSLSGKKTELLDVKREKAKLLVIRESEKKQLAKEKKEKVSVLNTLTSKEKKLRADLKAKQKQEQQLAAKIENIIRKEIEAAKAAAKKKKSAGATADVSKRKINTPNSATVLSNTPENIKLSNDFESNRGMLPWPVEKGVITSSFGKHAHPVWRDVVVNNNGIDINSTKGAKARSIFNGTVLRVIMVIDKYAVLVQHGEYFTLYSNLQEVYVKAGDKVITKQPLGLIQTNEEEGRTEVHLEVWRGSNKMDPMGWIAKR